MADFVERLPPPFPPARRLASKRLRDELNSIEMVVNGSLAMPVRFQVRNTGDSPWLVQQLAVVIQADITQWGQFGGGAPLTNGLLCDVRDSDDIVVLDITDGVPWKTNTEIADSSGSTLVMQLAAGPDLLSFRYNFTELYAAPVCLEGNHSLNIFVRDDLTAVARANVMRATVFLRD